MAVIEPGAHVVGAVEPVAHAEPAGHTVQLSACERPGVSEKVPSRHGSSAAAPGGQYEPASHALHAVAPSASWYVPPAHCVQLSFEAIDEFVYVPLAHMLWVVLPVAAK